MSGLRMRFRRGHKHRLSARERRWRRWCRKRLVRRAANPRPRDTHIRIVESADGWVSWSGSFTVSQEVAQAIAGSDVFYLE